MPRNRDPLTDRSLTFLATGHHPLTHFLRFRATRVPPMEAASAPITASSSNGGASAVSTNPRTGQPCRPHLPDTIPL